MTYIVGVTPSDRLTVRIAIQGAPRDSLFLRSYTSTDILRPFDLIALGPDGDTLRTEISVREARTRSRMVSVATVLIPGPLPDRLLVQYSIDPTVREGDEHTGFSGTSFGELNGQLGLVAGRNVFLIPSVGSRATVGVRIEAPGGCQVVSSLPGDGPTRRAGLDGRYRFEDVLGSTIGFGRFRERSVHVGRTLYRFAIASSVPAEVETQAVERLTTVARYLRTLFGRDLGPTYRIVIVPETPQGDEIEGNGWADGQGGTLAPATTARVHRFAMRLLEAYLVDPPFRSEIRDLREFWFVDGVRNLYAWRATAQAGLLTDDDVTDETIAAYVHTLNTLGVERDLERLYQSEESTRTGRDFAAPATLLCLDQQVRNATAGKRCLDDVVRAMFRGRYALGIVDALPASARPNWGAFRSRFVRGAEPLDVRGLVRLRAPRPSPDSLARTADWRLTLVYTGGSAGFLENCGCKVNQAGGVARRSTFVARLRRNDPRLLLVDAGNAFAEPIGEPTPTYLSDQEQQLYLRTMDMLGFDAAAVGRTELLYGAKHFRSMTRGIATPFLAANVASRGSPVARGSRTVLRDGRRIAIVGAFDPPRGRAAGPRFERNVIDLAFSDPIQAIRSEVETLRGRADLIIVVGNIQPASVRRIAEQCPEVGVVISSCMDAPVLIDAPNGPEVGLRDTSGFLGRTLVLYTPLLHYGIQVARLQLDRAGHIVSSEIQAQRLGDRVPDDPQVRAVLSRFYDQVGRADSAQASVKPLFAWDPARLAGVYVGASRCRECHSAEYSQWRETAHAAAFKTLLDRHRYFQPRCVSCHVVGYGARHGYRVGEPEEPLGDVQCEVCHGPAGDHVRRPTADNIRGPVPARVCLECHTPSHSDDFSYATKLPFVVHARSG